MAKFSSLKAPVTNPRAAQRMADTQAIQTRALVGSAPAGAPTAQPQAAAAIQKQAGQIGLQDQAQQAGQAKQQVGQQMAGQRLEQSRQLAGQQQAFQESQRKLDSQLFSINQQAADEAQRQRNDFAEGRAQRDYLQEQELADWALSNAKSEDEFKDRIQSINQAHARRSAVIQQAYKVAMQDLEQKSRKASFEDRKIINKEIAQMKRAAEEEQRKQQNEAANRSAMAGAIGMGVGALVGGAVAATGVGAPLAIGAMGMTTAAMGGTGASGKLADTL
jgi:hypothetical protein